MQEQQLHPVISVVLCNIGWTQNWIDLTKKYGSVCLWTKPVIGALYLLYGVFIAVHLMCIENDFANQQLANGFGFGFDDFAAHTCLRRGFLAGAVPVFLKGTGGPRAPHVFELDRRSNLGNLA